jgi:hypothetical protein
MHHDATTEQHEQRTVHLGTLRSIPMQTQLATWMRQDAPRCDLGFPRTAQTALGYARKHQDAIVAFDLVQ